MTSLGCDQYEDARISLFACRNEKTALAVFLILFLCELEMLTALDAAGANLNATASRSLWECDPLEVGVFAGIARRIEFCRADTVRITACHAASL